MKSYKSVIILLLLAFGLVGCEDEIPTNVGKLSFENPLKVPELIEPTIQSDGTKQFTLKMQTGTTEFLPGKTTDTWGINGSYLGPTVKVSRGDKVSMNVVNELNETSTLHWHGMILPAEMDGGPHQMIEAGDTWNPHWTIDQPAATAWYHPHLHGKTAQHVYRGLAGMFIIEDEDSKNLPSEYGVNDIPLIVQDKLFKEDGQFSEFDDTPFGTLGNEILINGTYNPFVEVTEKQIRFRLLNGSNARAYHFAFDDGRSYQLVANDAGLLQEPVTLNTFMLSPGERAEIVVTFEPGDEVILQSYQTDGSVGIDIGKFDLIKMIAASELKESTALPDKLTSIEPIAVPKDAKVRQFRMSMDSKINDKSMDMYRIDEVVPAGTTEIWEIHNFGWSHNFHIHDAAFRVLEINDKEPPEHERGRKDTVFVPNGSTVKVVVEFGNHPNTEYPLMYHCHLLRHEDDGMMGQFLLVEPGTESQIPKELPRSNSEHHEGHH